MWTGCSVLIASADHAGVTCCFALLGEARMNSTSSSDPGELVDDRVLVARAQAGNPAAMAELLARHFDYIHAICRRILWNPADAEDARQDALMQAARTIATFDGRSAFRTWLHTVTRNVCLTKIRANARRHAVLVADPPEPAHRHNEQDAVATRLDVESALAALPEPYREAAVLRYICDLDYAQIAETLDIPLNTVRTRLFKARAKLVNLLDVENH
jgi:RNA polymerase sigma-70 factor, ECF subfamily